MGGGDADSTQTGGRALVVARGQLGNSASRTCENPGSHPVRTRLNHNQQTAALGLSREVDADARCTEVRVVLAVVFALLASTSNAIGSVLQRRGALQAPPELSMRIGLIVDLVRRPVWLLGFSALIVAFICQAVALSFGGLALVQPFVVTELPLTLVVAGIVFRTRLDRDAWLGVFGVSVGLVVVLLSLAPGESDTQRDVWAWLWTCVASVGVGVGLVVAGLSTRGGARAALFGAASGLGFGFTAALMKGALLALDDGGFAALFGSWQLYLMMIVGVLAFFMYQNAQQAGSLVASQPAVTTLDPLSSVLYGVLLFEEPVRGGWWLLPTLLGALLIAGGSVLLSRTPQVSGETPVERAQAERDAAGISVPPRPGANG